MQKSISYQGRIPEQSVEKGSVAHEESKQIQTPQRVSSAENREEVMSLSSPQWDLLSLYFIGQQFVVDVEKRGTAGTSIGGFYNVILLYSREHSRPRAEYLNKSLKSDGRTVFFPEDDIEPSDFYLSATMTAIRHSQVALFLICPDYLKDLHLRMYLNHALRSLKPLILLAYEVTPGMLKQLPEYGSHVGEVFVKKPFSENINDSLSEVKSMIKHAIKGEPAEIFSISVPCSERSDVKINRQNASVGGEKNQDWNTGEKDHQAIDVARDETEEKDQETKPEVRDIIEHDEKACRTRDRDESPVS